MGDGFSVTSKVLWKVFGLLVIGVMSSKQKQTILYFVWNSISNYFLTYQNSVSTRPDVKTNKITATMEKVAARYVGSVSKVQQKQTLMKSLTITSLTTGAEAKFFFTLRVFLCDDLLSKKFFSFVIALDYG
eukprot:TRINITY_DN967_c0_g1_i1.p1 TRINITY_DN967_c0_g1~~TRINITY_DN967_c0_g1_i1.p1  ORF type:complete len:131 (-),score=3.83 TRINITY_DN967_c0_g1_i1:60-452(-)